MESIEFFQVFILIIVLIMTLFYIYFRSLTSSSSAAVHTDIPPLKEKYDVFISFRGEDTRDGFTSYLHKALLGKKIETYMDYRLEKGDNIGPALLEAIEKSKIALVIFSKDYASSTWCLKELVHILGCKKSHGQIVIPIFYRIDPSHVRKQQGTYALGGLLWRLKKHFKGNMDEVRNWKAALGEAANMSGFHYSSKTGTEADFVEEVVQDVLTKLNRESSSDLRGLFGIQRKIGKIESLLCLDSPGVCCVGIWGMGGIGKTTLADAVFHRQSSKFEAACFHANVRENSEQTNGLNDLRTTLVRELLKDKDVNIKTPSMPPHIQDRLRRTKALIVLDDVNAREQLEVLVGDHDRFCQGSQIIITARDKGLLELKVDQEKIYNVEGLGSDKALELFHLHAFGNKSPTKDYTELSREVVHYIKGIPLALKVMGSLFHRCKRKQEWEAQWNKLKRFPSEEIEKVLRLSYNGLEENEKGIFLDIACFYKDYFRKDVERMLDSCDFFGEAGINDLIDRSLISISKDDRIVMHDLVQEMGRAIAREQRSRLFNVEDVYQVLTNNQMESISFEIFAIKFSSRNLVGLDLSYSQVVGQFWNEDQGPVNLKWINLAECRHLTEVPNLSRSQKIEHIDLSTCISLVEIPSYFQHLGKLTYLHLRRCTNLKNLPEMPCNLEFLNLYGTAIEELPSSVWSHEKISHLDITNCRHLKSLPSNTCKLKLSGSFSLRDCESLCEFWELPKNAIGNLVALQKLDLHYCKSLESLPELPPLLQCLEVYDCTSLESLPELPPLLQCLEVCDCTSLKTVSSSSTAIAQGWEEYIFSRGLHEKHIFSNCPKLDENARSNIMGDAQFRIMRMAIASSKFKEDKIEEAYDSDHYIYYSSDKVHKFYGKRSLVAIRYWGYEIPKWFSHKSEGCSIKIELPRDWFSTDFLGFALSIVANECNYYHECIRIECKYNFKTSNGESHEVKHPLFYGSEVKKVIDEDSHELYVWYNNVFKEVVEGAQSPTAFYKLVTEVNVHFTVLGYDGYEDLEVKEEDVKKCGICLLYGKDAEIMKQRALYAQGF